MSIILLTGVAAFLRILSNPLANAFQKSLTANGHHALVVNFMTYLGLSIPCLAIIFHIPFSELPDSFWFYSILAGIAGALGNGFLVRALEKGEISVLGPINAYKSVVGLIAGVFLLGEIPNIWGALGTALIIWGSYFVLDTTEQKFSRALLKRKDIQYRVWALILTAIEAVLIKKVILASTVGIAFVSWCCFGALFSYLLLLSTPLNRRTDLRQITRNDLGKYACLILCIGTMQLTTNYVFNHMPVGYALALFQLSTIVSVLLGYRIFKEQHILKKLVGSAIMIIGSLVIILLK